MGTGAIVAIIAAAVVLGAAADRGTTNPGFKAEQHKTMADPSNPDNS